MGEIEGEEEKSIETPTCVQCGMIIQAQAPYAEYVSRNGDSLGLIHSGCKHDWKKYHPDDDFIPLEP